jgi:hypothetical protein
VAADAGMASRCFSVAIGPARLHSAFGVPMRIERPSWQLKSDRCSYCGGQGELIFSRCPACSVIVLICAECGTAYAIRDKKPGEEVGDTSGSTRCFSCAGPFNHDFPPATAEEIQALGFAPAEYR